MIGRDVTRKLGEASASVELLAPGDEVEGWRIERHLATGGFGSLYQVVHAKSDARGALKLLHAHLLASPEMVARLVREAQVIGEVRHRSVVELLAAGVDTGGRPYLVMELLDGEDLSAVLARRGRLAPAQALVIVEQVALALQAAHERGVIHRDVKASNVVSCRDGRVVLVDFGIAKVLDGGGGDLTASRQTLGTPASMAPEQIRGGAIDARTDVYALGALAFHLITGRLPYEDSSPTMSQYLHLHAERPKASAATPVPPAVDAVIARGMAIDPARRHSDPLAFFAALRDALGSTPPGERAQELTGVLVRVRAPAGAQDDAVLDDVDRLLPLAEAALVARGFAFGLDLGDAVLFVCPRLPDADAVAAAVAVGRELARRPGARDEVGVSIAIHHARATVVGETLRGGELLDLASWAVPEDATGVWISTALSTAAGAGPRCVMTRDDIG